MTVIEVWRTGRQRKKVVKYKSREEKERIMVNKKKLGTEKIFIDNDPIWEERKTKILEKARELRMTVAVVRIGYSKVSNENEKWIWNEGDASWFRKKRKGIKANGVRMKLGKSVLENVKRM